MDVVYSPFVSAYLPRKMSVDFSGLIILSDIINKQILPPSDQIMQMTKIVITSDSDSSSSESELELAPRKVNKHPALKATAAEFLPAESKKTPTQETKLTLATEAPQVSQIAWNSVVYSFDHQYSLTEQVGHGAFGLIYTCYDKINKFKVIAKVIEEEEKETAITEAELLKELKNTGIIKIHNFFKCKKHYYLILEKMDADLHKILNSQKGSITSQHHKFFMIQILEAVKHLHSKFIVHRDLKTQNILMNANCTLKLCDFGAACKIEKGEGEITEEVQTRWYRAPELLLGSKIFTSAIDMWSVGCIFAEIMGNMKGASGKTYSRVLFRGDNEAHQILQIVNYLDLPTESEWPGISKLPYYKWMKKNTHGQLYSLSSFFNYSGYEPLALDLLSKLLVYDPKKRITASEALSHDYFKSF